MQRTSPFSERVLKGTMTVFALNALASLIAYFTRSFYSHTLSVEMYGLFYAGINLFGLVWTYADLGFGYSITYLMPKYVKSLDFKTSWSIFRYGQTVQIVVSVIFSILLFFLAPVVANNYFKIPGSENFIYLLCLFLVANTFLSSLIQFFMGLQVEMYYSLITFLRSVLTLVISIFAWFAIGAKVETYMSTWIIGYVVTAILFLFVVNRKYKHLTSNSVVWDKSLFRKMGNLALPMFFTTMVYSLLTFSDTFLLTIFKGVAEVGVYNVVFPLASVALILFTPFNSLLQPLISHLMEGERDKIAALVNKLLEFVPFVATYFALFLVMFPKTPIALFYGQKWLGISDKLLGALALGVVAQATAYILGAVILGIGKVKERLKATAVITFLSILLNIVLIPRFGVAGTVVTNIGVGLVSFIVFQKIIHSFIKIVFPSRFYLKLFLLAVTFFIVAKLINYTPLYWFNYILTGLVYSVLFAASGLLLQLVDKKTLNLVFVLFRRRIDFFAKKQNAN